MIDAEIAPRSGYFGGDRQYCSKVCFQFSVATCLDLAPARRQPPLRSSPRIILPFYALSHLNSPFRVVLTSLTHYRFLSHRHNN